jgi:hypothetical protein
VLALVSQGEFSQGPIRLMHIAVIDDWLDRQPSYSAFRQVLDVKQVAESA